MAAGKGHTMTRAMLTWFLLSLTVACTPGRQADEIKQVQVTEDRLRAHSADNPYVVELTRSGTVYEVPAGVDQKSIDVRAAVDVPLSVLARRFAGSDERLLIGTLGDLDTNGFGFPPDADDPPVGAGCIGPTPSSPGICNCTGKRDCSDMNRAGLCTGGSNQSAVCGKGSNGKWGCSCVAKGS